MSRGHQGERARSSRSDRWWSVGIACWLLGTTSVAVWILNSHYPIGHWLFPRYALVFVLASVWLAGCTGTGLCLLRRFFNGSSLPLREQLVQGTGLGVLAFALATFTVGVFGLLEYAFFPLLAAFGVAGWRDLRAVTTHLRKLGHAGCTVPRDGVAIAAWLLGLLGVGLVYFGILAPVNLAYDSRWYHLALAEDYASGGAVRRFEEGSFQAGLPQLATYLYTWAFCLPGASLFMRVMLAAHVEFMLLLFTLASLGVLVRWVTGGRAVAGAWAGLFLFPGLFVYDSTLSCSADHVLAAWSVPTVLAFRRYWREPRPGNALLVAALGGAALMTKYQAIYFVVPVALGALLRAFWRSPPAFTFKRRSLCLAAMLLVGLVVTAPLWLKNWVWYHNPVFPYGSDVFPSRPWSAEAVLSPDHADPRWVPQGSAFERLREVVEGALSVGFSVHDWTAFHGAYPVFGFLFALLWPLGLVLPGARRLRVLSAMCVCGVLIWYATLHQDRYLQALVPLMATVVVAVLHHCWRRRGVPRALATGLVLLQVVWSGDHAMLPSHAMHGRAPIEATLDLLEKRTAAEQAQARAVDPGLERVAAKLPARARVLIHGQHLRLGIGRPSLSDAHAQQSGFAYPEWHSAARVHAALEEFGVTHLVWSANPVLRGHIASELVFFDFVTHYAIQHQAVGNYILARAPDQPPPEHEDDSVLVVQCQGQHRTTLSELEGMLDAAPSSQPPSALPAARFAVARAGCARRLPPGYVLLTEQSGYRLYSRAVL